MEVIEHVLPAQHIRQYYRATSTSQGAAAAAALQISVKQYIPQQQSKPGDITILAAPSSGSPKEIYEPLWHAICQGLHQQGHGVRSIIIMDYVNQAQSANLNKGKLGSEPSMFDHARDVLCVVNHLREEMTLPIVGVGHSIGGTVLANVALMHPRLLCALVMIEPALNPVPFSLSLIGLYPTTFRKDVWPSREAAIQELQSGPLKSWDPRVQQLFFRHGIKDHDQGSPPGSVTLAVSKHQEAFNFARAVFPPQQGDSSVATADLPRYSYPDVKGTRVPGDPFYRPEPILTAAQLPRLRPGAFYIYGGGSTLVLPSVLENRRKRRDVTGIDWDGSGGVVEGRVEEATIANGGHYVPQEKPDEVGKSIADYISKEISRWKFEDEKEARAWSEVSQAQKESMDDRWMYWVRESAKQGQRMRKPKQKL